MDPLARLEEAAARVLGRTLSAATPRVETAAAGLLDLAPGGRGGAFSSAAESPCGSQVLGEGPSEEETFYDNASDVSMLEVRLPQPPSFKIMLSATSSGGYLLWSSLIGADQVGSTYDIHVLGFSAWAVIG